MSSRVASATVEDSLVADATRGLFGAFSRALKDTAKLMATLTRRVPCGPIKEFAKANSDGVS
jgi:hypothetical protein